MFRRIQVFEMQAEVDVWQQLGQFGPTVHQMSSNGLPPQTSMQSLLRLTHLLPSVFT